MIKPIAKPTAEASIVPQAIVVQSQKAEIRHVDVPSVVHMIQLENRNADGNHDRDHQDLQLLNLRIVVMATRNGSRIFIKISNS